MNLQKFIYNDNSLFEILKQEREYDSHIQHLQSILLDQRKIKNKMNHMDQLERMKYNKFQSKQHDEREKFAEIQKNNNKLLDKLLNINTRGIIRTSQSKSIQQQSPRVVERSKNYLVQKNEAIRIAYENSIIVDRLSKLKPTIQIDIRNNFKKHQKELKRLSRSNMHQKNYERVRYFLDQRKLIAQNIEGKNEYMPTLPSQLNISDNINQQISSTPQNKTTHLYNSNTPHSYASQVDHENTDMNRSVNNIILNKKRLMQSMEQIVPIELQQPPTYNKNKLYSSQESINSNIYQKKRRARTRYKIALDPLPNQQDLSMQSQNEQSPLNSNTLITNIDNTDNKLINQNEQKHLKKTRFNLEQYNSINGLSYKNKSANRVQLRKLHTGNIKKLNSSALTNNNQLIYQNVYQKIQNQNLLQFVNQQLQPF